MEGDNLWAPWRRRRRRRRKGGGDQSERREGRRKEEGEEERRQQRRRRSIGEEGGGGLVLEEEGGGGSLALLTWMKRSDEGEKDPRCCSCCGVTLESGFCSPYLLLKPSSWGVLDYAQKVNLVGETAEDHERIDKDAIFDQERDKVTFFDQESVEGVKMALWDGGDTTDEREKEEDDMGALISEPETEQEQEGEVLIRFFKTCLLPEDASLEVLARRMENVTDEERLVPLELIESITMMKTTLYKIDREDDSELGNDPVEEDAKILERRW